MTKEQVQPSGLQAAAGYLLVILLLVAMHAGAVWSGLSPVLKGEMPDTDTYTRLVRVQELAEGGGWFNSKTERMNAPYGDVLNWTRPLDVLIIAGALPLKSELGYTWREAIFWSGALLPPVLQLLFGFAVVWMAAPFFSAASRPLLMLFVCAQPIIFYYNLVGRPDHQTVLLVCTALILGFIIRALLKWDRPLRLGLWAGLWAGLGLWMSTEFEFVLVLSAGTLALMWLWQGERRMLELLEGLGIGFLLLTVLGVLAERGGAWSEIRELDKISLSQLIGASINCGLWGMVAWLTPYHAGIGRRTITLVSMGASALFLLAMLAPELLRGPAGDIDPRVMEAFFLKIREMRPLWPVDAEHASLLLLCLGMPLLGLPLWFWSYRREALSPWLPLIVLTLGFTIAGLFHARFAQFAAPFGAVLLLAVIIRIGSQLANRPLLLRAGLQAGLLVGPILLALVAAAQIPPKQGDAARCDVAPIREALNALPRGSVMSSLNYGPEIIYFTHHDTVAGPYHRNTAGILDSNAFFGNAPDADARQLLKQREITYVLACPDRNATEGTRAYQLTHGHAPGWLKPLSLPEKQGESQDFRLFEVN